MGNNEFNIFKIVEGREKVKDSNGSFKRIQYIYNAFKPLYETPDITEAYYMFDRMVSEGYRDDMMLILDFGIMSREQRNRCNRVGNKYGSDSDINDLVPYINLAEFHKVDRHYNGYWNPNLMIEGNCASNRFGGNAFKILRFFINNYNRLSLTLNLLYDIKDEYGDDYAKIRTVASDELLREQTKYRGCKIIKVERSIRRRRKIQPETEILLLECHDNTKEEIEVITSDEQHIVKARE